jgi:hypothetical protein
MLIYYLQWRPSWISDRHKKPKWKIAVTAGLSLTLDPMGKVSQSASSLNPLGQFKPNCPGMIIGSSSSKFRFFMPIGNPRWPPLQVID